MKFTTKNDIEAPIDYAFERVSNFAAMERMALKHGVEFERQGDAAAPIAQGTKWDVHFEIRGRSRSLEAEIVLVDEPNQIDLKFDSGGLTGETKIELVSLSVRKTRVIVTTEIRPKSITARLFVQSLRLAKGNLDRRIKKRMTEFSKGIEADYRALNRST